MNGRNEEETREGEENNPGATALVLPPLACGTLGPWQDAGCDGGGDKRDVFQGPLIKADPKSGWGPALPADGERSQRRMESNASRARVNGKPCVRKRRDGDGLRWETGGRALSSRSRRAVECGAVDAHDKNTTLTKVGRRMNIMPKRLLSRASTAAGGRRRRHQYRDDTVGG